MVRHNDGSPRVIRNEPFLADGTPMPTRYWLVSAHDRLVVSRLESSGGVGQAEAEIPMDDIMAAHAAYEAERDSAIPADHQGPRPSNGVGGTRRGIKCLHAHYAHFLATGSDAVGTWVQERLDNGNTMQDVTKATAPVAAIDCGTNSTRLLVSSDGETLERLMTITRLGAGVDATGRLAPEAIQRVMDALSEYRRVMDSFGVEKVRMTATSAARDAENSAEFFDAAEAIVGVRPELLSGADEALLSFQGATAELDPADGPFLVVDIGGGSTEFAYGTTEAEGMLSTDMGCVRFTEKYILHDPAEPEELVAALSVAQVHVDDVLLEIPESKNARVLVGLAGTVSSTAMIEQGIAAYDRDKVHHFVLTKDAAEDVFRTLASENRAERMGNPGMEEGRVDVIVGGLCVLVTIMRKYGFEQCLVSEADILDGLALSIRN